MFKEFNLPISEEKFAAFLDGCLSEDEMNQIQYVISQNQYMQEIGYHCMEIDETYQYMIDMGFEVPFDENELVLPILDDDVLGKADEYEKNIMLYDRSSQKLDTIKTNDKKNNDMSNDGKFNLAPGAAAVSAYAAHKLYTMFKYMTKS